MKYKSDQNKAALVVAFSVFALFDCIQHASLIYINLRLIRLCESASPSKMSFS